MTWAWRKPSSRNAPDSPAGRESRWILQRRIFPDTLPKDVALSLYRIIQEGLTNIAKYACARHATVSLKGTRHGIFLSLQDDGIGFDAAEVRKKPGLGLSSMRERVRIIRGKIRITSEPGKGTTILVNVPLKGGNGA